jgi:hypothetical protein
MRPATNAIVLGIGYCVLVASTALTNAAQQSGTSTTAGNISEKITVTGCLERGEQAATPATGTTGAAKVAAESFVLINAGSSTSVQTSAGGITYMLDGGSDLAAKVGHRVEVKGTATSSAASISAGGVPPSPEAHEAGAVTAPTPGTTITPALASNPHIHVSSIRVLGDCSSSR